MGEEERRKKGVQAYIQGKGAILIGWFPYPVAGWVWGRGGGLLSDKGANNNDALVKQQGTKRLPQSEVISVCRGVLKGANSTGTLLIYKGASTIGALLDSQSSSLFLIDGWRPTTT
jgi:hypothetical protein